MSRWQQEEETVELVDCVVKHATARALLVEVPDVGEPFWVPRSVIDDSSEVMDEGDEGELVVKAWWANKEGIL